MQQEGRPRYNVVIFFSIVSRSLLNVQLEIKLDSIGSFDKGSYWCNFGRLHYYYAGIAMKLKTLSGEQSGI